MLKNKDITNKEIREAFDIIDSDGDGQISFEEFEAVPYIPLPKLLGFLVGFVIGAVVTMALT